MDGTVDLALVPAFVEVVRQGSFTKAAAVLQMPKSTVSRHVSRLERELGAQLLIRTTRSLRLTEQGEGFYARVAPALEQVEEAGRRLSELHEAPRGTLRVTMPHDLSGFLTDLVCRFTARYPEVRVEVSVSGRTVDLVAEGFDMAVRAGRLSDSTLVARKLADSPFHLFAAPAYLEAHGEPATVAELAEHDCVLFRPQHGRCRWTLEGPNGPETVEVTGRVAADELTFLQRAVLAGAGIGLMPGFGFGEHRHRVRRVLPEHEARGGGIYVVYPGAQHLPAKVRAFRDFLVEQLEEPPWGPATEPPTSRR